MKLFNFFTQNFIVFLSSTWSSITFGQFSAGTQISKNIYTFITQPFTKNYIAFFSPNNIKENQTNFLRLHKLQMYFFSIPYILLYFVTDDILHLFYEDFIKPFTENIFKNISGYNEDEYLLEFIISEQDVF